MVFSSVLFLVFYLPIVCLIYYIAPLKWRNLVLLVVNLIFYGWGEPLLISVMLFSTVVDYINGYYVGKYRDSDRKKAKRFMICSIVINLSLLAFFKYYDFVAMNLNSLGLALPLLHLTLPIGISFYTFQTMSYTIDVYRNQADVQKNMVSFATYVTLFPQLIAGPIVRYKDVSEQMEERSHSASQFSQGIDRFIVGLSKKVLLANNIGMLWESIHAASNMSVVTAWLGAIAYGLQIYFDFSGYSDMAIGLGKMFGFTFLENFNYPYISKSISEFWRRWHISLGTWFREYVYIPLGGNRKGSTRTLINLAVVWFLTGLWHGASWNFILWGVLFGVCIMFEKAGFSKFLEKHPIFGHVYTLLIVACSWVIFALTDMTQIVAYFKVMFGQADFFNPATLVYLVNYAGYLVILLVGCTPLVTNFFKKKPQFQKYRVVINAVLLVVCLMYIVDASYNPFLYFRF